MSVTPINTVEETVLLKSLRQFLVDHGVGRDPRDATGQDVLPPIWVERRLGVPYPGQTEDLEKSESDKKAVMHLEYATEIPSAPMEGFISKPHVVIMYRTKAAPRAFALHKQVKDLLHDQRNYSLSGLQVNESLMYRGLQPLGSDSNGYVFNTEFEFQLWSYA